MFMLSLSVRFNVALRCYMVLDKGVSLPFCFNVLLYLLNSDDILVLPGLSLISFEEQISLSFSVVVPMLAV